MLFSYFFFRVLKINPKYDANSYSDTLSALFSWILYALLFVILYGWVRSCFDIELNFISNLLFKAIFVCFSLFVMFFFVISEKWKKIYERLDKKWYKFRIPGFVCAVVLEISLFIYTVIFDAEWIVDYYNYPLLEELRNYLPFG